MKNSGRKTNTSCSVSGMQLKRTRFLVRIVGDDLGTSPAELISLLNPENRSPEERERTRRHVLEGLQGFSNEDVVLSRGITLEGYYTVR